MPNMMAALPNVGGALCSTPQSQSISAVSGLKFTILWGHMEEILLFNKFFFRLLIHALVAKIWPDKVV